MTSVSFGDHNQGLQVGSSHGPIYYTSEQPEPRPEPLSTVPFRHDPDFVSRDELLDQIHEKSSILGSRIVLVGLGGLGEIKRAKSRLAVEYCHRVRQQSPDTWVFWVHASNAARCEESLRNLADRAKVPGREDRNSNIFQLFGNWLQDGKIGKWILVLDNVDDDELLRKPLTTRMEAQANTRTQPPLRYLFESSNGSIIITSRNRGVALELAGHKKYLIDVQPMNTAEALVLMQKKLDDCAERDCAEREELVRLVEELEFMPLAIVQAASYITHRSPRCSVLQYLEKLLQSDRQAAKLLNHEGKHIDRDWEAKNSILLTWQISFDHIRQIRQSTADLLSLMSFFDPQGIPEDLLRVQDIDRNHKPLGFPQDFGNSDEDTDCSSEPEVDDDFESDIAILRDYSFITSDEDSMVFTMHRLVQLTVRIWLKTNSQEEQWKERFIKNLYGEFPTGQYENWEKCQSLFPHIRSAVFYRPKSQDSLRIWATLLYRGAWYAIQCGSISVAVDMAAISRKQRIKIGGAEDKDTLASTVVLAEAYGLEGRWEEAEQLFLQVIETSKTKLGADHPNTLASMANLALTYTDQGRWKEAEQLSIQVIETSKTKLGADHPNTLASMVNLALTYMNQGRLIEAEQLEQQVIETSKTKLGADHPNTLASMANLASTYRNQGRLVEAEKLEQQVIETRKTKLGADHPDTLISIGNLASTYRNQGRWAEAEQLEQQVIEFSKMKLGADHPNTLTSVANLATTYMNQGRWEEAEQLLIQVIETCKTKLGADHPKTLTSMSNLAFTWESTGQHVKAIDLLRTCVAKQQRVLGPSHPHTVSDGNTLLEWETAHLTMKA
ncbi:hypothetical protein N7463_004473 [Penicillium fimorum]|uniref:Kinesin light chain n=1 Tax=Penicillium fimorum TaxID=1882269 RepID=A0A9W9Y2W9_9EURO|nr:hypothetical protein N7463_004473 [Penicillium fimorum]